MNGDLSFLLLGQAKEPSIAHAGWMLLSLFLLAILQQRVHVEVQSVLFLLFHRVDVAILLFSLLFLPGVLVHEVSHYLCARLLGVRTGRVSLFPKAMSNGKLQLGFVETARTDILRDALIGSAPLLAGMGIIAYITLRPLGLSTLWQSNSATYLEILWGGLLVLPQRSDVWLWLYLTFVISSTMLPSTSDRRAWLPVVLVVIFLLGVTWLMGAGPWLQGTLRQVAPWFLLLSRALGFIFGLSAVLHGLFLLVLWVVHRVLMAISRSTMQSRIF